MLRKFKELKVGDYIYPAKGLRQLVTSQFYDFTGNNIMIETDHADYHELEPDTLLNTRRPHRTNPV